MAPYSDSKNVSVDTTVKFIFSIKAVCLEILIYDLIQRAAPQTQNNSYKCQLARGAI